MFSSACQVIQRGRLRTVRSSESSLFSLDSRGQRTCQFENNFYHQITYPLRKLPRLLLPKGNSRHSWDSNVLSQLLERVNNHLQTSLELDRSLAILRGIITDVDSRWFLPKIGQLNHRSNISTFQLSVRIYWTKSHLFLTWVNDWNNIMGKMA